MIEAGTIITCPNGHEIAELNVPLLAHDAVTVQKFNFREGQEKLAGEDAKCNICGARFLRPAGIGGVEIHTKDGWSRG